MLKRLLLTSCLLCFSISSFSSELLGSTLKYPADYMKQRGVYNHFNYQLKIERNLNSGDTIKLHFFDKNLTLEGETNVPRKLEGGTLPIEFLETVNNSDHFTVSFLVTEAVEENTTILFYGGAIIGEIPEPHDIYLIAQTVGTSAQGPFTIEASNELKIVDLIENSDSSFSSSIIKPFYANINKTNSIEEPSNFSTSVTFLHSTQISSIPFRGEFLKKYRFNYRLTGEFSFLKGEPDSSAVNEQSSVKIYVNNQPVDYSSLVIDDSGTQLEIEVVHIFNREVRIEISSTSKDILPQNILASVGAIVEYKYQPRTINLLNNINAGKWRYDGEVFSINNMPFGSAYSHLISLNNKTNRILDLDIILYSEQDESIYLKDAIQIESRKITNITQAIKNLITQYGLKGNIAIDIIADTERNNISLTALFYSKMDGDRAVMSNTN